MTKWLLKNLILRRKITLSKAINTFYLPMFHIFQIIFFLNFESAQSPASFGLVEEVTL